MKLKYLPLLSLGLIFLASPAWGATYTYYRSITVTSTTSIASGTNSNFPMLFSGTYPWLKSFSNGGRIQNLVTAQNGGQEAADLIFTTSTPSAVSGGWNCGTPLNFETESYASSTGAINDWINVPSMSAGQTLYACYGAPTATTDQSNPGSTWNSNYLGVWHLPNINGTLNTNDSTANGNNGTNEGVTATTTGIFGGAGGGNFNGTSAFVGVGNTQSLNLSTGGSVTMCFWMYSTVMPSGWEGPVAKRVGSTYAYGINFNNSTFQVYTTGGSGVGGFGYTPPLNSWQYICGSMSSNPTKLFINGSLFGTYGSGGGVFQDTTTLFNIGESHAVPVSAEEYFEGILEEVRVSNTALSPSWILTEYNNQYSPSTFYAIGSEQTNGSSTPSLSNLVFNGGTSITLIPNTTMSVSVVASTTDTGGAGNIAYATSTIYRTSLGQSCAANNANCYKLPSSSCSFSGGTSTVTCTAGLWYFAQSTGNASSSFPSDSWSAAITLADNAGVTTTATSNAVNVNVLTAINVTTSSINYGTIIPNTNTGSTNQTVTVQNVGNSSTTLKLSGTAFVNGVNTIATSSQHYATSTFTFGGSEPQLSDTLTTVSGFILAGPTSTSSVQGNIYWGDAVPSGMPKGTYVATTTFSAAFSQ